MTEVKNPIQALADANSLSLYQLALALDVSPPTIYSLSAGTPQKFSKKVAKALLKQGFDPEPLREEYAKFRAEVRKPAFLKGVTRWNS